MKYNELSTSHSLIMQSLLSERIKISSSGALINSITINKLADRIVKETFSFGITGQILALIGPRRGAKSFLVNYLNVNEENIITTNMEQKILRLIALFPQKLNFHLGKQLKLLKIIFTKCRTKKEKTVYPNREISPRKINKLFKILFILATF